jgi:hypothetical protein
LVCSNTFDETTLFQGERVFLFSLFRLEGGEREREKRRGRGRFSTSLFVFLFAMLGISKTRVYDEVQKYQSNYGLCNLPDV